MLSKTRRQKILHISQTIFLFFPFFLVFFPEGLFRLLHWTNLMFVKCMEKYQEIFDSITDTIGYIFLELILETILLAFTLFVIFERLRPIIDRIEANSNDWQELLKMEFTAHPIEWVIFIFVVVVWALLRVGKFYSDRRKARKLEEEAGLSNFILLKIAKNQGVKTDELIKEWEKKKNGQQPTNPTNNPDK